MNRCLALLLVLLSAAVQARPAPPPPIVVVTDFVVTGENPRAWLGPVYAEVLLRRLERVPGLMVIEPLAVRMSALRTPAATDDAALGEHLSAVAALESVPFAIGGRIVDHGAALTVTPMVAASGNPVAVTATQDVAFDQLFQPQIEIVLQRFLGNLGLRLDATALEPAAGYQPPLDGNTIELLGQGWLEYQPEAPEQAFITWRKALALDPRNPLFEEALASTSYPYHRVVLQRALEFYREQVALTPDDPMARFHLAEVLAEMGSWREAEHEYRYALHLRNGYLPAMLGLGIVYLEQGLWQQADELYTAVLQTLPTHRKALHNKAVAVFRSGDAAAARLIWQHILQLYPDDELARQRLEQHSPTVRPTGPLEPEFPREQSPIAEP